MQKVGLGVARRTGKRKEEAEKKRGRKGVVEAVQYEIRLKFWRYLVEVKEQQRSVKR